MGKSFEQADFNIWIKCLEPDDRRGYDEGGRQRTEANSHLSCPLTSQLRNLVPCLLELRMSCPRPSVEGAAIAGKSYTSRRALKKRDA